MKISEMSKKQLKEEYISVCELIDITGCFGVNDLKWRAALEVEIEKRGMIITNKVEVKNE